MQWRIILRINDETRIVNPKHAPRMPTVFSCKRRCAYYKNQLKIQNLKLRLKEKWKKPKRERPTYDISTFAFIAAAGNENT